jgi:hypothetical protein
MKEKPSDGYTDEEIERRATEAIRRSAHVGHKPLRDFVGKTDRARAMARRRKAKTATMESTGRHGPR